MRAMPRRRTTPPAAPAADRPHEESARKPRSDGIEARERLLLAALRLFAEKGYKAASTREIAQAAGANIAAISYYFGDKAGLYRAAFLEPICPPDVDIPKYEQPHFTLRESLDGFIGTFIEPLRHGELARLSTMLRFREMVDPTGVMEEEIASIKLAHAALVRVLARHLGIARADDDVHRLALSIAGLGVQLYVMPDIISAIRPNLLDSARAYDAWRARLTDYAAAMVAADAARRQAAADSPNPPPEKKKTP